MASTELIKQLREMTGAGINDCKKALDAHNGSVEKAAAWLKEQGLAAANKKSGREAKEGVIEAYSHTGGRVAVLVEVNCETDFVARTPEFKAMAHDIALQVVSMNPKYVKREDVPAEVIAEQTEFFKQEAIKEGKKPEIAERIAQGRLNKFYEDNCLMDQIFVKDDKVKISDLLKNSIAKLGENMMVRRFVRYEVGE
ncbi:MAG TPA: translation elongation factor Ts [Thermoflexales bacterium]|nr:translation elongation factor Ts [Thermoflexales bacterium]HQW36059.1 translation elongation factor Ts [Thermoflexales bacterium]HQX75795.1 translation elongation factor Ts [Thermoflexales bacterium]HQZ23629.1 translation elongation factor Ts [Thermoflexales bacterium]